MKKIFRKTLVIFIGLIMLSILVLGIPSIIALGNDGYDLYAAIVFFLFIGNVVFIALASNFSFFNF